MKREWPTGKRTAMWVDPEIRLLGDIVRYHARKRGNAAALICARQTVCFAELDRRTNRVAQALLALRLTVRRAGCITVVGKLASPLDM